MARSAPSGRRLYTHEVDGMLVTSTLSAEDLAAMPERRRKAVLARMLRDTPNPTPAS